MVLLVLAVLATGVTLAVRNHRRGRTDLRGAGRLAAVLLTMPVLRWLFALHHAPRPDALLDRFFTSAAVGALYAIMCLLLYLALEPFARRIWPQVMIGWTRLLSGGWRDPMVGRSLLVGGAMVRGGLLAFATGFLLWNVIQRFPLTLAFDQAYAATSLALLAGIIALLTFAFSTALGGRSLLEDDVASLPRETGGGGTVRV